MDETSMTLAHDYQGERPTGWWITEQFNGVRAYWDGTVLWTRGGRKIAAPAWFTKGLPAAVHLDGEIYGGRQNLRAARLAVQHGRFTRQVLYMVFDAPLAIGPWEQRMQVVEWVTRNAPCARAVPFRECRGRSDLRHAFIRVVNRGGEGLILRNPDVDSYERGRTRNLLKVKTDCHL